MQHTHRRFALSRHLRNSIMVLCAVIMVVAGPVSVFADQYDDQIIKLQADIDAFSQQASTLRTQAASLQGTIDGLVAQQNAILAQIQLNEVKLAQLRSDIAANQKKLEQQQAILTSTLATLYINGSTSPVEMLAGSSTIGDYSDQQQYLDNVREGMKQSITRISDLKATLEAQQKGVEHELADQQSRNATLAQSRREQAEILAQTQGQEAEFQKLIADKSSQAQSLREQQAAANRSIGGRVIAGDPNHGGYPSNLANAPQDSMVDPWGMYNRECVSYTAWKVYQKNGYMPYWGGVGNANQWPGNAVAAGIRTSSVPKVHSVAVWNIGYYGHVMWVEAVNGDLVTVSQYNYDYNGHYSEMTFSASATRMTYIYF